MFLADWPPGLVMVLTAALEFDPRNNKEATIRPTDNVEVPQVKTEVCFIREETWFEGGVMSRCCF